MGVDAQGNIILKPGTPVAGVKAAGTLTLTGRVLAGEKVLLNGKAYTFLNSAVNPPGEIAVNVTAGTKTQATGTFTFTGVGKDGETITIGDDTYELDTDGVIQQGNIAVNLAANAVAATGTLTFAGAVADGETVTIGTNVYEFDTDGAVGAGNIPVNVAGDQGAPAAITALVAVITALGHPDVTVADGALDTLVATAKVKGADGNAVATTETCANAAWGAATLAGGADPTDAQSATGLAAAITNDLTGVANGAAVDVTADAAGTKDGAAGNLAVSTTCANGAWGAATLSTGSDATAAEAVTALVTAITGDANAVVTAADGAGDTVVVTAKAFGTAGNTITTTETLSNGSFAKGTLEGGVNGTVAKKGIALFDANFLYIATVDSAAGDGWKKIALNAL